MKASKLTPKTNVESTKDRGYGAYLYAKYLPKFWGIMGKLAIHKETCNRSGLLVEWVERASISMVDSLEKLGVEIVIAKDDINQHFEIGVQKPPHFKELCEVAMLMQANPKLAKDIVGFVSQSLKDSQASKDKPTS